MSILTQKTIDKTISVEGIGLHTGKSVKLKIHPQIPNCGIIFKRVDIKNPYNEVYPNFQNVTNTLLCTTIENKFNVKVSTIEHLMAALFGLGIDNALIELDSEEVPILDGSAKEWCEKIIEAGIASSDIPIKIIKIEKKIKILENEKYIEINKSNLNLDIDFEIKYPDCLIGTQRNKVNVYNDDLTNIFNSRTFCKFEDIDKLKSMGLAKGGNLNNAIVVNNQSIINKEGLRNNLEFVNHKILDCMGDLFLSGYKIVGSIKCSQGGHSLTNKLLREVFKDKKNYSIIELKGKNLPHSLIDKYRLKSIA